MTTPNPTRVAQRHLQAAGDTLGDYFPKKTATFLRKVVREVTQVVRKSTGRAVTVKADVDSGGCWLYLTAKTPVPGAKTPAQKATAYIGWTPSLKAPQNYAWATYFDGTKETFDLGVPEGDKATDWTAGEIAFLIVKALAHDFGLEP